MGDLVPISKSKNWRGLWRHHVQTYTLNVRKLFHFRHDYQDELIIDVFDMKTDHTTSLPVGKRYIQKCQVCNLRRRQDL